MSKKNVFIAILACFVFWGCEDDEYVSNIDDYVSYFSFDNHLVDEAGYTVLEETPDSVIFIPGIKGQGIEINENTSSIPFDKKSFRNNRSKLSISIWIKTNATNIGTRHLIWCDDFIISRSGKETGLAISIPQTNNASGEFTEGEWTHLVGTYDGSTIRCYINGELEEETTHPGKISTPDRHLRILRNTDWTAMIDEFYIYDKVLNIEEIKELYEL